MRFGVDRPLLNFACHGRRLLPFPWPSKTRNDGTRDMPRPQHQGENEEDVGVEVRSSRRNAMGIIER